MKNIVQGFGISKAEQPLDSELLTQAQKKDPAHSDQEIVTKLKLGGVKLTLIDDRMDSNFVPLFDLNLLSVDCLINDV